MSITKYNQSLHVCPPAVSSLTLVINERTSSKPTSFLKHFFYFIYQPVSPSSFLPVPSPFPFTPSLSTPPPCCAVSPPLSSIQRHLFPSTSFLNAFFPFVPVSFLSHTKGLKYSSPILLNFSVYPRILVLT